MALERIERHTDMTQTGHQANHPLVSVCMLCYNQEQYITEAVEGMLAQTYSPLEIIISDDCSTDRTWEILQKIKDNYTGQHQLAIHRNEKNLRIIRNLCTAFHLAHGELVIKAEMAMTSPCRIVLRKWSNIG